MAGVAFIVILDMFNCWLWLNYNDTVTITTAQVTSNTITVALNIHP